METDGNNSDERQMQIVSAGVQLQQWSGPLPPPEAIERYELAAPGTAKILIEMAVGNHENRMALERRAMGVYEFTEKLGLVLGFLLCLGGLVIAGVAVVNGYSLAGFGVFFTRLAALVAASVYREKNRGGQ